MKTIHLAAVMALVAILAFVPACKKTDPGSATTPAPAVESAVDAAQPAAEPAAPAEDTPDKEAESDTAPVSAPGTAAAAVPGTVIEINSEADFNKVLKENKVVLVDFYADWCGPCKMLKPTIRELARDYAGKVAVAAVNVDKQGVLANKYGIQSIPDVKAFKDGEVAETLIGLRNKPDYAATLDKLLQ